MLTVIRNEGEFLHLEVANGSGEPIAIRVEIVRIESCGTRHFCRVGVEAPLTVKVVRGELHDAPATPETSSRELRRLRDKTGLPLEGLATLANVPVATLRKIAQQQSPSPGVRREAIRRTQDAVAAFVRARRAAQIPAVIPAVVPTTASPN